MWGYCIKCPMNLSMNFSNSTPYFPFHMTDDGNGILFNGVGFVQSTVIFALDAFIWSCNQFFVAVLAVFSVDVSEGCVADDSFVNKSSLHPST